MDKELLAKETREKRRQIESDQYGEKKSDQSREREVCVKSELFGCSLERVEKKQVIEQAKIITLLMGSKLECKVSWKKKKTKILHFIICLENKGLGFFVFWS